MLKKKKKKTTNFNITSMSVVTAQDYWLFILAGSSLEKTQNTLYSGTIMNKYIFFKETV